MGEGKKNHERTAKQSGDKNELIKSYNNGVKTKQDKSIFLLILRIISFLLE